MLGQIGLLMWQQIIALCGAPLLQFRFEFMQFVLILGLVRQVVLFIGVLVQIEKLELRPGMISLYDGSRLEVSFAGGIP